MVINYLLPLVWESLSWSLAYESSLFTPSKGSNTASNSKMIAWDFPTLHKVQVHALINEITVESFWFWFFKKKKTNLELSKHKEYFRKVSSSFFPLVQVLCYLFCRGMQQLLDYPEDDIEEAFCLNFTVSFIQCLCKCIYCKCLYSISYQAYTVYYNCFWWSIWAEASAADSHVSAVQIAVS